MGRAAERLRVLTDQARSGDWSGAAADLRRWIRSDTVSAQMRRDFSVPFEPKPAEVALTAVPLDDDLARKLFDVDVSPQDRVYLERRRSFWETGFDGGFVAVTDDGDPAYLQWLIPNRQHDLVTDYFGPLFPDLGPDGLVVEGAWVPPAYRKKKVMGEGLSLVSEAAAAHFGAASATCFPEAGNKGAVRGSQAGGYVIEGRRIDSWRMARRSVHFEACTAADLGY